MENFEGKNPYMDYRRSVPFINIEGFLLKQPFALNDKPMNSLKDYLMKKKFSTMINLKRLEYLYKSKGYENDRSK